MSSNSLTYVFRDFVLDASEETLIYKKDVIQLEPRVFQTLLLLVENAGRTITKDEFLEKVWNDAIVEEGNLPVAIAKLRKSLKHKDKSLSFVETVPRKGYRFNKNISVEVLDNKEFEKSLLSEKSIKNSELKNSHHLDSQNKNNHIINNKFYIKWIFSLSLLLLLFAFVLFHLSGESSKVPTLQKMEINSLPDKKRQLFIRLEGENFAPDEVSVRVIGIDCSENNPCEVPNGAIKKFSEITETTMSNVPLTLPPGEFQIFAQNNNSPMSNGLTLQVP